MVDEFVKRVEAERLELHEVIVSHNGEIIGRHSWLMEDRPMLVHSVTKSFVAIAAGFAINEGKLSLSDKVVDIFPDKIPEVVDGKLAALRVEHLLNMTSGVDSPIIPEENMDYDWVRCYLHTPRDRMPGEKFQYDNNNFDTLSEAIQRRVGMTVHDYLKLRMFDKLEIAPVWNTMPSGASFGSDGMYMRAEELWRFGEMLLNKGMWNGIQVVPEWWIAECTKKQSDNSQYTVARRKEMTSGYGYGFWLCHNGAFRADGYRCQEMIVWPQKKTVIVLTGKTEDDFNEPQIAMNLAWEYLDPTKQ